MVRFVQRRLILDDLGDGAHGALLDAVTTSDASILVGNLDDTADNFQNAFRAGINADAAADALISFDNRMGHSNSFVCAWKALRATQK